MSHSHGYGAREHYDRVGAAWSLLLGDELHYGVFMTEDEDLATATRRLTDMMVDAADLKPGLRVLDVGCGSGGPAAYLAAKHEVHVTGITTSAEGVAAAERRAEAEQLTEQTRFLERDGMENGFPDDSFERVWVLESSHLMRRRDRLVAECARVLVPGGRVVLCDIMLRRELPFAEVRERREEFALLRDVFGAARMEPVSQYRSHLLDHGLEVSAETDITLETRPTFARWRENAERHNKEVKALLGEQDAKKFRASCDVLQGLWDEGTLGYTLIAASKREPSDRYDARA